MPHCPPSLPRLHLLISPFYFDLFDLSIIRLHVPIGSEPSLLLSPHFLALSLQGLSPLSPNVIFVSSFFANVFHGLPLPQWSALSQAPLVNLPNWPLPCPSSLLASLSIFLVPPSSFTCLFFVILSVVLFLLLSRCLRSRSSSRILSLSKGCRSCTSLKGFAR